MSIDPVLAQIRPALEEYGASQEFYRFLGSLADRHPDYFDQLLAIGARVAWFADKVEAAGFSDHLTDYFFRPIIEGALTLRDIKDGTADVEDIVAANEALDRYFEGQRRRPGPQTKPAQDKIEHRLAELPPGLTICQKAERLKVSESTIYRILRRQRS